MDSRFSSVRPDDDPRYPGMVVATVRELRDLVAFYEPSTYHQFRQTPERFDSTLRDCLRFWGDYTLHPAGRNVASFDRQFVKRVLPSVDALLSFKHFDITALRLVGDLLGAPWVEVPFVGTKHRAMDDVNHDVACWRATLRALGGEKPPIGPEIPSFDETKSRLADLAKAYADGREARIQTRVDVAVQTFLTQLGDMDGSRTCGYICVGDGFDSCDSEAIEARTRLAELFKQRGYHTILKTTHVEIRLSAS